MPTSTPMSSDMFVRAYIEQRADEFFAVVEVPSAVDEIEGAITLDRFRNGPYPDGALALEALRQYASEHGMVQGGVLYIPRSLQNDMEGDPCGPC